MPRLAIFLVGLGLAACAPRPGLDEAVAAYGRDAAICRTSHPHETLPEAARRLGAGEMAYRDCLREAAARSLLPALPKKMQRDYQDLLLQEQMLDQEIAAGYIGRVDKLIAIDAASARLAAQWERRLEADRRARRDAAQIEALQRQLSTVDDLIRAERR